MGESAKYLAGSKYIRDLATLVVGYGMAINIVEVTWKAKLKARFPDPAQYSAFMGGFSSATGTAAGGAVSPRRASRRRGPRRAARQFVHRRRSLVVAL